MLHQRPALSKTLSSSNGLRAAHSPTQNLSLLLVLALMAALMGAIHLASISPYHLVTTQTAALPTSYAPHQLLNKPELVELRSAYASHFDLGNGQRLAVVGATPLNYQDAQGNWQPIQPGFTAAEDGWRIVHNSLRSAFAGDSTAFQVESGGQVFGWQPLALEINDDAGHAWELAVPQPGRSVQAESQGTLLRYANAWSDETLVEQFQSGADMLEQELILATAPDAAFEGEWLSLRVDLVLPTGMLIVANGQSQTGEFTTYGALQFQQADGTPLLALAPPLAYEQGDHSVAIGGRYRAVPHGNGLTLWVQTPLAWWLAAERNYPAVIDPIMQVLRATEAATVGYPYDVTNPDAFVQPQACVGLTQLDPTTGALYASLHWSDRGYIKFKLPNLPDGAVATQATLVGAPERSRIWINFWSTLWANEDTLVYRVTDDWSYLQGVTSVPTTTALIAHAPTETDRAQIPYVFPSDLDPDKRPVTAWNVTSDVQGWYLDPSSNHGFALVSEYDGHHLDPQAPNEAHNFYLHCFPTTSMVNLNDVLANPGNPTTHHAGLGLLIEYTSPQLAANELRTVLVPSAVPGDAYLYQHHEYVPYIPPSPSSWKLMAARGQRGGKIAQARLQLTQTVPSDPDLKGMISDAGLAAPGNEAYEFKSNYVVVNGYQSLPTDLALHVLPDTFATDLPDDDRKYHLQIADAIPSPAMPEVGTAIIMPIPLGNGFIAGQELDLSASTTVEIQVPYGSLQPYTYNLQLFPPSLKYGSREVPGIQLTQGPDAWEIEIVINPGQEGTWLLAAINDGLFSTPGPTLNAQVVACQNSPDVIQYPVDGVCVELQTPPTEIPTDKLYQNGNVRIYSPAGFEGDCSSSCTTVAEDGEQAVAALIGYVGDDDNWVAVKGGQFGIESNVITTTQDVRLIMARFNEGPSPITLPVLRGQFEVTNNSTGLIESIGTDLYPLVKAPLPEDDMDNGWTYTIDLSEARMRAEGPLTRVVEPTESMPQATFGFDAQWSITARGGQDLLGGANLASTLTDFNVGTLIVDPLSVSDYSLEHNPADVLPSIPQAMPEFEHIRLTGATLKQPTNLGGAQVPVQAVILPPGKSVVDPQDPGLILYCGTAKTCFDLRGETDAMEPTGPHTVRQYRMPDLIIQDQAGTVMINMPQGVEIYSRDHPESHLGLDSGGYSFSYEAFGATIRTYQGTCPLPRDALNPTKILPGTAKTTTVVSGTATLSLPNAESTSGGPQIGISFWLCEGELREMSFIFSTGDQTALPLGNSGLFLNLVGGTISLAPEQGPEPGYTTVALQVGVRGMSPDTLSSNVFVKGVVTIDTRGLFDMQLQAGLKVVGGYGVGVDGHFWVAWAPLDLGFEVQACAPYSGGFDAVNWPLYANRCDGNELLFGSLRAHLWQGQGWQHQYHWLPDNDDVHIAAKYTVSINIAAGLIVDWEFVVIPPNDIQLYGITLAFGEFCTNQACTSYEWGVTGAYTLMGYDFGIYYGFDSGLDFILGSADYLLIDEAGGAFSAGPTLDYVGLEAGPPYTVTIPSGTPSAMFALGWDPGSDLVQMDLRLETPDGTEIDEDTVDPAVTVAVTPTTKGWQTVIVVEDPIPGEWRIYTDGSEPLPPHQFVYMANKPEPTLNLAGIPEPPEHIEPGDVIEIEWESNISPQDTAWLSLYYTTTNAIMTSEQEIGGPIVERLPLTPHGTYEWHVQGLAYVDNDYHVFARIDSEATAEINGCGESYEYNPDPTSGEASCAMLNSKLVLPAAHIPDLATFWYEDWVAPAAPTLVGAQAVDWTSIMVLWEPNGEVDLAGYLVRCGQTGLVRTARVPAQHMTGTLEYESAQVNGLLPYENTPATCSLRAYDTSGNVSGDSSSAQVVMPEGAGVVSEATISPDNGATLISVDEKVTAVFPAGLVESETRVKLTVRALPPHPIGPLEYAGPAFNLSAYGPNGVPVTQFLGDFALTVNYGGLGLQPDDAEAEEDLYIYWWDGEGWRWLLPCEGCSHDVEGQRFIVVLDHLSEFAVLAGEPYHLYLPLIMKAE